LVFEANNPEQSAEYQGKRHSGAHPALRLPADMANAVSCEQAPGSLSFFPVIQHPAGLPISANMQYRQVIAIHKCARPAFSQSLT